jgi:ABC-type lipoprotein release transport system permease subunit
VAVLTRLRAELRARWRAWGAIALLIGVAGGVVLTTAAGARRTDTAYTRYLHASRAADLLVSPQNIGRTGFYDAVGKLPEVTTMATVVGVSLFEPKPGGSQVQGLLSIDGNLGRTIERPKIVAGRMYRPDSPNEAVADRTAARALHLKPGMRLQMVAAPTTSDAGPDFANAYPVPLEIVGIGVTRENVVPVSALAAAPTLLATPALLQRLDAFYKDKPFRFDSYDGAFVSLKPGAKKATFTHEAEDLARQFPDAGTPLFVADQRLQATKVQTAIRPQATALALFSLLAAVSALFVVGQIVSRQLFLAASENPTLRALGMSKTQLVALHLGEVVVVGAAGAVVAVIAAILASPFMPIGPARIAEPNPGLAANWAVLGLGAAAIVVLLLARALWPAWRLAAASSGIQGAFDAPSERPSRVLEAATRAGAPASAAVGLRLALEPGRGRTAVPVRSALAGTVLAIAAVTAAFTFGANLVRLVHTPQLYGQQWDLAADTQFGLLPPDGTNQFLGMHRGVQSWSYGDYADLTIKGKPVPAIGVTGGRGSKLWPRVIEGRAPRAPDELILGTKTLDAVHAKVGDTVAVTPQGETQSAPMRIVGRATFPFFGRGAFGTLGLGEGAAIEDPAPPGGNCDPEQPSKCGFNFVLVRLRPGPGRTATVAGLRRELPDARICPLDQECNVSTLQRPVDILNYSRIQSTPLALAALLGLLALATVGHLLVTSIRRRRRDLAVLKTLGFVRRQVSAAVAWQATVLVGLALLIGLPIGVAAGRWVWQVFAGQLGVPTNPAVPLLTVLLAVPMAIAVANVLAAGPGWVAGRLKPAPVLRTE